MFLPLTSNFLLRCLLPFHQPLCPFLHSLQLSLFPLCCCPINFHSLVTTRIPLLFITFSALETRVSPDSHGSQRSYLSRLPLEWLLLFWPCCTVRPLFCHPRPSAYKCNPHIFYSVFNHDCINYIDDFCGVETTFEEASHAFRDLERLFN